MSVTQVDWDAMAAEIQGSGFFGKPVVWRRCVQYTNRYQEDGVTTQEITIHTLSNYNYMRSWPITVPVESGEIDRQSIQLLFLRKEFQDLSLLTPEGYLLMDPARDRFVMEGLIYKPVGDTFVSQAGSNDILISIIVKREETPTGTFR